MPETKQNKGMLAYFASNSNIPAVAEVLTDRIGEHQRYILSTYCETPAVLGGDPLKRSTPRKRILSRTIYFENIRCLVLDQVKKPSRSFAVGLLVLRHIAEATEFTIKTWFYSAIQKVPRKENFLWIHSYPSFQKN